MGASASIEERKRVVTYGWLMVLAWPFFCFISIDKAFDAGIFAWFMAIAANLAYLAAARWAIRRGRI